MGVEPLVIGIDCVVVKPAAAGENERLVDEGILSVSAPDCAPLVGIPVV